MNIPKLPEKITGRLQKISTRQYAGVGVILLFAVIGSYFLFASHADTPDPNLADDTGTYIHEHGDDFTKDIVYEQYILQQDNGKRVALDLPDGAPNIITGTRVRIRGHKHGNRILIRKHQKTDSIQKLKSVSMSGFSPVYHTEFTTAGVGYWYRPITNLAVIPVTINAADGSTATYPPAHVTN